MTDRKNVQPGPLENEETLRLLIESVSEYAIFQLDPRGHIASWNAGAQRMMGYRAEEVLGRYVSLLYDEKNTRSGRPGYNLAEAANIGESKDEGWRVRKDGTRFWASVVTAALRKANGDLHGFIKITRDVTERRTREAILKEAKEELERHVQRRAAALVQMNLDLRQEVAERKRIEGELRKSLEQLRALAARLQHVREEERALVAREMHDDLGQACTAIKMDLASIGRKTTSKESQLRAKVQSAMELVDKMIFTVRRIASELRPRTLDDLGLMAALEWQAQEFESRTGTCCILVLPKAQLELDFERSTAIFRIFQESLTNVARHAQATRVEARLEKQEDQLIFAIRDNGVGFDARQATRKSLGLVGMQERALLLNGELAIEGVPGSGTTVTLRIPLPQAELAGKER